MQGRLLHIETREMKHIIAATNERVKTEKLVHEKYPPYSGDINVASIFNVSYSGKMT